MILNVNGHGGARAGAGRPRADILGQERRKHSIYCTADELVRVRAFLQELRLQEQAKILRKSYASIEKEGGRVR